MNSKCCNKSSLVKKYVMAITGLGLVGFVVGHLLGNLTIFGGPELLNAYAKKLHDLGPLLWVARIGLLALVAAHIIAAIKLTQENQGARDIRYKVKKDQTTSYAAKTMPMSGLIILGFIIFHLLHFTFDAIQPEYVMRDAHGYKDVYKMVYLSFQHPWIVVSYLLPITLLCLHLSHGLWSMFQSLGFLCDKSYDLAKKVASGIALIIWLGYISVPLACYFDFFPSCGKKAVGKTYCQLSSKTITGAESHG